MIGKKPLHPLSRYIIKNNREVWLIRKITTNMYNNFIIYYFLIRFLKNGSGVGSHNSLYIHIYFCFCAGVMWFKVLLTSFRVF